MLRLPTALSSITSGTARLAALRSLALLVPLQVLVLVVASCTAPAGAPAPQGAPASAPGGVPALQPAAVCDNTMPGPDEPPAGAVVVSPSVDGQLSAKTVANPPGTTFWLRPGRHTLGTDEYGQVAPKDGNTYIGAPGAILDGRGLNNFAFTTQAQDVTIRHLTVRGFTPPADQGVVNHDSGDGWVIEYNTLEDNGGAAMMSGARQQVRFNCLRNNGQYGMNAYQAGNAITDMVVEGNEITGNNTDDWEKKVPGCGCTGGVKFWSVDGADIRGNWIHDNRGTGLWADTNNNDFLIEDNVIENNDGEAVFYETSYNLVLRNNIMRRNALVNGRVFAERQDDFPVAAVYLSEAGGEPRVPARTDKIDIYGNLFADNWSGITAWENADRFCNSAANTSTGNCTRIVPSVTECAQPAIAAPPLYDDCRWKTQRVDVHENTFTHDPAVVGCFPGFAGRMAILSNFGTYPDWSPYMGDVVQKAIANKQDNRWRGNSYSGPWTFMLEGVGRSVAVAEWQAAPNGQDAGSSFAPITSQAGC